MLTLRFDLRETGDGWRLDIEDAEWSSGAPPYAVILGSYEYCLLAADAARSLASSCTTGLELSRQLVDTLRCSPSGYYQCRVADNSESSPRLRAVQ